MLTTNKGIKMSTKMKYAVVMTSDYTAKLFTGRVGSQGNMIAAVQLNSTLPMSHQVQRQIIDAMLSENNVTPVNYEFTKVDSNTDVLYGEFINFKSEEYLAQRKVDRKARKQRMALIRSEAGFSLIELAVACAIMLILAGISLPYYMAYQDAMIAQAEKIEQLNQSQQYDLETAVEWVN